MNYKKPEVKLLHATPLALGEVGARSCYNSFTLSENESIKNFENDMELPFDDIESSALLDNLVWAYFHESVTEHISLSFFIKNVSREIVIELNRHRIGIATSQKSTRYTMEGVVNAWIDYNYSRIPDLAKYWRLFVNEVGQNVVDDDLEMITITARYISDKLKVYNSEYPLVSGLTKSKKKVQNDRVKRCLPETWMLQGLWTFNLRALKHFIKLRDFGSAYPPMQELAQEILKQVPKRYLNLIKKSK